MSKRSTMGSSIPRGRLLRMRSMAARTSSVTFCGSEPISNSILVVDSPWVTVD